MDNDIYIEEESVSLTTGTAAAYESESKKPTETKTLNAEKKRKKGVFNPQWKNDSKYASFLKECRSDCTKAMCIACNEQFSVHFGGKNDVDRHAKSKKHVTVMRSFTINRQLITSSMKKVKDGDDTAAAEESLVYHGVKHAQVG